MHLLPVFLDLSDRPCLVVGAGPVGCARAAALLEAGAEVLLVDPLAADGPLPFPPGQPRLTVAAREFRDQDCLGRVLVYACTDRAEVNRRVFEASREHHALCCRADGGAGDFLSAVSLRRGQLCVAVSSGGASPRLAKEARDRAASVVGEEFAEAARLLGGLRRTLRGQVDSARIRADVLGGDLAASLLDAVRQGKPDLASRLIEAARERALLARDAVGTDKGEGPCTR